ncbi:sporulation histidine kinase inhibitor Sda [Pseudobacillus wudalianchiensis]|nr:sporulation histidine kinase inhibitor Sda [Bacillus wudalianchiensis]
MNSTLILLSDKQLIKVYCQAKELNLSIDFISLLQAEMNRRKLLVVVS